ncbi:AMP-binding protein [Mycobacterium mantenii]|uniref:Acyl-CoA synthetase n=1 Tax=Mycobacterium mantenii TaxID=560555 RepID=A0A1A2TCE4_MYCNT|nr:AMP-binding protein [Mycobacterium mantenii]OBH40799.1 acyl-CoA synthetase [Mycobacterium mantenii]OBH57054.1 acyl-CoA synthetase [Mycobacterium mantenii]OBH65266.1 acyl-CoA synthetase [Mycobacterium mantenii]OBH73717.1 acyl-CoA synthetase [Mycobacterium mantenii]
MLKCPIPTLLRERASLQPNQTAFTFINYDHDPDGIAESLTWSRLHRRVLNLAQELRLRASPGDRAVVLAPPGLDYISAFLGALQAGLIAVPLGATSDERVDTVLRDASPSVILTTSSVAGAIADNPGSKFGESAPPIVEVDLLDLDSNKGAPTRAEIATDTVYLQYTSGSTRTPVGVMVTYKNIMANFGQINAAFFGDHGGVAPPDTTVVSWLPFYHDMGLHLGIIFPVLTGFRTVLLSPVAFLQRPARWIQLLATNSHALSAGPNFAFELAARKTSDGDLAGQDLGNVLSILNGSERVQPATLRRFTERFAPFNLPDKALRPSYGMAEATLYVATREAGQPPRVVHFGSEELTAGLARRWAGAGGTPLVSYGAARSPVVRIVNPDSRIECPAGTTGEIWVHGDNVATGYWQRPRESEETFGATVVTPSQGTPEGPWLRTGDLGFFSDGELFIVGRIKDLLIVYGRNHSPDDLEATIQSIAPGRCAAISVPDEGTEKLVAIIEFKKRAGSGEEAVDAFDVVKRQVTSAISNVHGLSIADLVVVAPGSIPITTSGKVRRAACVERYRQNQFARLDT